MQRRLIVALALTSCLPSTSRSAEELKFPTTPPTAPQKTAKTFHVLDGFEMQLIAAEPLVTDPVAITYGDGEADVRQKVFTGFKKLNVQAVMNNPVRQTKSWAGTIWEDIFVSWTKHSFTQGSAFTKAAAMAAMPLSPG